MRKTTRQILFFFFAGAFLVSAPLVVLYTAGYRFSLNNYRVLETGAIATSTTPHGATIFVDAKKESTKTPTVIQNVLPHDTNIRFERSGYISWEQTVPVNAGKTTYVSTILYADAPTETLTTFSPGSVTARSSNGRYLLVVESNMNSVKISLYDVLTRFEKTLGTLTASSIPYSVSYNESENVFVIDRNGTPVIGYNTNGEKITASSSLLSANAGAPILLVDNGNNTEVHTAQTDESVLALLPRNTYEIVAADEEFVVLRDARQILTVLSLSGGNTITLDVPGTVLSWQSDLHLLVWSDGMEVSSYDATSGEKTFLTRQSELIASLAWHPSGSAIIVGTASRITAVDKEAISNRVSTLLVDTSSAISDMWLDKGAKNLYFLENTNGTLTLESRKLVQ